MDGVDLAVYSPRPPAPHLRQSLGIAPDEKIVVFIGVLTEYQGIDILLQAVPVVAREFPKVKFLIIGYPEESYRQKARKLGIENWTCFTGRVPFEQAPDYLSMAQIAVSPKISTTEANLKLFNYMAMGLPAVVFDNSVNREILGDLGVYVDSGNVEAYAQAIVQLLKNPETATELGRRAQAKATRDHSWVAVGQRLLTIYDHLDQRPGDGVRAIAHVSS
jgi:glycosyltransferase involved in cell wall biosynthesis